MLFSFSMYKCSAAPVSLVCFPFFVLRLLLLHQSLFPIFNLIYAQLLFTVRGGGGGAVRRGRGPGVGGGGVFHEESVQGDGGGG